jgi:hypothetical protein
VLHRAGAVAILRLGTIWTSSPAARRRMSPWCTSPIPRAGHCRGGARSLWMNGMGCETGLAARFDSVIEARPFQVNPMFVRRPLLAQKMVRIRILPVMGCTKRNRREV